jgi:hypothetical protein
MSSYCRSFDFYSLFVIHVVIKHQIQRVGSEWVGGLQGLHHVLELDAYQVLLIQRFIHIFPLLR